MILGSPPIVGSHRPALALRRTVAVRTDGGPNSDANRAALARMSECERICGHTADELRAMHAWQRQRVLERWGRR